MRIQPTHKQMNAPKNPKTSITNNNNKSRETGQDTGRIAGHMGNVMPITSRVPLWLRAECPSDLERSLSTLHRPTRPREPQSAPPASLAHHAPAKHMANDMTNDMPTSRMANDIHWPTIWPTTYIGQPNGQRHTLANQMANDLH